jgi:DNA-binding response OmpR family regulator
VADDDKDIARLIADSLADEGMEVTVVHNGLDALKAVSDEPFDMAILDIMMPGADGLGVCARIRDSFAGTILFVTAKNRTLDTMLGLEIGGDDYITKPFVVEELVARVKAHLRRNMRQRQLNDPEKASIISIGGLRIHPDNYEVLLNGNSVELSTREFQLLHYLAMNRGRVLSRDQIFDAIWGQDFSDVGTVTQHIKNLRAKLDPSSRYIKTVWGVGYKFVEPSEDSR